MSEWQPISTAPKTGKSVLAYVKNYDRIVCVSWQEGEWRADVHSFVPLDPDYWMELPPKP